MENAITQIEKLKKSTIIKLVLNLFITILLSVILSAKCIEMGFGLGSLAIIGITGLFLSFSIFFIVSAVDTFEEGAETIYKKHKRKYGHY